MSIKIVRLLDADAGTQRAGQGHRSGGGARRLDAPLASRHEQALCSRGSGELYISSASGSCVSRGFSRSHKLEDDPRRDAAVRWARERVDCDEQPPDWTALLSLVFGVFGLFFRSRLCAWAAVLLCGSALADCRASALDTKQLATSASFAALSLAVNYSLIAAPEFL